MMVTYLGITQKRRMRVLLLCPMCAKAEKYSFKTKTGSLEKRSYIYVTKAKEERIGIS